MVLCAGRVITNIVYIFPRFCRFRTPRGQTERQRWFFHCVPKDLTRSNPVDHGPPDCRTEYAPPRPPSHAVAPDLRSVIARAFRRCDRRRKRISVDIAPQFNGETGRGRSCVAEKTIGRSRWSETKTGTRDTRERYFTDAVDGRHVRRRRYISRKHTIVYETRTYTACKTRVTSDRRRQGCVVYTRAPIHNITRYYYYCKYRRGDIVVSIIINHIGVSTPPPGIRHGNETLSVQRHYAKGY